MQVRNETEIQLMKILFKTSKKKTTKNITSKRGYPFGAENKLYTQLKSFFKPLTEYVNKYIDENMEPLLRGDSTGINFDCVTEDSLINTVYHLDAIAGKSFRNMVYNMEDWLSVYMPDIADLPADSNNNVILTSLSNVADDAKKYGDKEFEKAINKGINVNPPIASAWWNDMKKSWAEDNYTLIVSNAKNYVSKINTLVEQAIVNGKSPKILKDEIKKATQGLSDKHCKLLARDQMGKLNGQITQNQMQELGLDLYVWSTAYDDRVRDSHALMEGLLCRWDDASVCSYDNGKTWVNRPAGAVQLHPGQDIQCRCVALSFFPELQAEVEGVPMKEITEDLPPIEQNEIPVDVAESFYSDGVETKNENFKSYIMNVFEHTDVKYAGVMNKLASEHKRSVSFIDNPKKTSYFSPSLQKVFITSLENKETLRHEMGHFLDYAMGETKTIHLKNTSYTQKEKLSFSLTSDFTKAYEKEVKGMVKKLYSDSKQMGIEANSSFTLARYLTRKYPDMTLREKTVIHDMFTAVKKRAYGGHTVSYFKNGGFIELKNKAMLNEGFAELCETYTNEISEQYREFIKDNFSESIPIINKAMEDYLSKK